jgi:hypothetical protein
MFPALTACDTQTHREPRHSAVAILLRPEIRSHATRGADVSLRHE